MFQAWRLSGVSCWSRRDWLKPETAMRRKYLSVNGGKSDDYPGTNPGAASLSVAVRAKGRVGRRQQSLPTQENSTEGNMFFLLGIVGAILDIFAIYDVMNSSRDWATKAV